ncbi:MAG: helix-turn-helix domain-containing protein [Treponema sp.]|jgi:transcriptional regulator with XRE-family HTH domain|nr:helix-turn-helix domain-containing protein [Treponema sp.]
MEEKELRAVFVENIKKYRNRRGWNQLFLAEKLDISSNFLSEIETGKGWVSPLTLVKLANALEIKVSELFTPIIPNKEIDSFLKKTVENVCKEYL